MLRLLLDLPSWHFQAPRAPGTEESAILSTPSSAFPLPASAYIPAVIHQLLEKARRWPRCAEARGFPYWPVPDPRLGWGDRLRRIQSTHVLQCIPPSLSSNSPQLREGWGAGGFKAWMAWGQMPHLLLTGKLSTLSNLPIFFGPQFL